jgi:sarcosine oxidase
MAARSTGDTRIFRLAHQRPELVDWAAQARRLWDEWSAAAGERLVGDEGTVISGDVAAYATAMSAAGAPHHYLDDEPSLPSHRPDGPLLFDPGGGVIQAAATGRFLLSRVGDAITVDPVTAVTVAGDGARMVTASGHGEVFDSVVITAGAGTAALAAGVGIDVPTTRVHHARFTFRLRDKDRTPPCWIERSGTWREGFTSYGHVVSPGHWAVGGHPPDDEVRWDRGAAWAVQRSREIVTQYAADYLTGVEPTPVGTVYCDHAPGLGDGLSATLAGRVLALWGNNLFKLAPVIGRVAARAAVEPAIPDELIAVGHRGR